MSDFSEIRDRVDIVEVYERETANEYRKNGSACAFCASSDAVHFKGNRYKCFSCGWGGGVVDFVATLKGIQPAEAGRFLQEKYLHGVALDIDNQNPAPQRHKHDTAPEINYKYNPALNARFFELCRQTEGDPDLINYLNRRGFTRDIRVIWNIVTISLTDYYRINNKLKQEYSAAECVESGLFRCEHDEAGKLEKYNLIFSTHRILLFNKNDRGDIIGVIGRSSPDSPSEYAKKCKYINSFGTKYPYYTSAVYNTRRGDDVIICEGQFDAVACNEMGFPAVAVGGVGSAGDSPVFRGLLQKIAARGLRAVYGSDNDTAGKDSRDKFQKIADTVAGLLYVPRIEYADGTKKDFADVFQQLNGAGISHELTNKYISIAEKYTTAPAVLSVQDIANAEGVQPFEVRRGFMDLIKYFNFCNISFSEDYRTVIIKKLNTLQYG